MSILSEYSWESDTWTHPTDDTAARAAFRQHVADIAAKAKETLPECNDRVDSAVKIVLAGDVEILPDGKAKVASQSNGTTAYHLVNGECPCKDFPQAPSGWCKHRIAAGLAKRVAAQVRAHLDAPATGQAPAASPAPAAPAVLSTPLPEVPAIVSTTITVAGRRVEVKLCDTDDARLLARLQVLLAQYPMAQAGEGTPARPTAAPATDETPACTVHGTTLKESTKAPGTYYCPVKDATTGKYCTARWPAKAARR